ncbi:hypothetical protein MXB_5630 [Myxobolus squamalis]|nr:hypothetical protein MXB_5630 [Myxobolus squamalis]
MKVHDESPAYLAGVQPYFDFIVKINDISMTHNPSSLVDTLKNFPDTQFDIVLYNIKMRSYRTLVIRKNAKWTGESILGVDILKLTCFTCWYYLIDANEKNSVKLIVYNSETDATREVTVVPNRQWKSETKTVENDSLLGCGIGYGLIHRIPHMRLPANFSEEITSHIHAPALDNNLVQPLPQNDAAANLSSALNYIPESQPFDSTMYKYSQSNYATDYSQSYSQQYYYPENYEIVPNPYHQYQHVLPETYHTEYSDLTQDSYNQPADQI